MDEFVITSTNKLNGEVWISGSKNSTMPILISTLLLDENYFTNSLSFQNISFCDDICIVLKILRLIGLSFDLQYEDGKTYLNFNSDKSINKQQKCDITINSISRLIRTSIIFMGPLVARYGRVKIPMPGGCNIGERKIDIHIEIAKKAGCEIIFGEDYLEVILNHPPKPLNETLRFASVGASHNTIMLAALANGVSIIKNISIEPEVTNLIYFLQFCGLKIDFNINEKQITIYGTNGKPIKPQQLFQNNSLYCNPQQHILKGEITNKTIEEICVAEGIANIKNKKNIFHLNSDRIEAGTFAIAAAITKSNLTLLNCNVAMFDGMLQTFDKIGINVNQNNQNSVIVSLKDYKIKSCDIKTEVFPGFPTDMQPQMVSLLCLAEDAKQSKITETVFENRFLHINELKKLGADIAIENSDAIIRPIKAFYSNANITLTGTDLRTCAGLILASILTSTHFAITIKNISQLDRGYEFFEKKLNKCGANIKRIRAIK